MRGGQGFKSAVRAVREYADPRTAEFRKTLDSLPDEIALAIGLHVYDDASLGQSESCICGWVVREAMARELNILPEHAGVDEDGFPASNEMEWSYEGCVRRFGGGYVAWKEIFCGVTQPQTAPLIEEALFDRVMAASDNLTPKRAAPKKRRQKSTSRSLSLKSNG